MVAELKLRDGVTLIGKFESEFGRRAQTFAATGTLRYAWRDHPLRRATPETIASVVDLHRAVAEL